MEQRTNPESRRMMEQLLYEVKKVIVGQDNLLERLIVALLARGHILVEGVPGLAKTMAIKTLAEAIGGEFKRIQFTPDLVPADLVGTRIYNQKSGEFNTALGPVFTNLLLADEINRATPRTQAALLECMAERQVSSDGVTYDLPRPFLVVATQNPMEQEGTFPLPEAQLDRFMVRLSVGYPSFSAEQDMLERQRAAHPIDSLGAVMAPEEFVTLQRGAREVYVHEQIRAYIVQLVQASRDHADVLLGGSPRASQALYRCSQAMALMEGRTFKGQTVVLPDHVREMYPYVMGHRVIIKPESRLAGTDARRVVENLLQTVPAPVAR